MNQLTRIGQALALAGLLLPMSASADRLLTNPPTSPGDPALDFVAFTLNTAGTEIIATGLFSTSVLEDRVYSIPVPSDFSTAVAPVQLSTGSFLVGDYDVDFVPTLSPDGGTILYSHDGRQPDPSRNTIHTMPITGETGVFNGLFAGLDQGSDNNVSPGQLNFGPVYSPNGNSIFFINGEAGFGGSIPTWTTTSFSANDPTTFTSVWGAPDWDVLYSVPAAGGAPIAITSPADGDIDDGLVAVTPDSSTVVYAPDNAVATPFDRGDNRPTLYTVPAAGGASTAIPMDPAPNREFTMSGMLELSPDGQSVLFVGDYDTPGQNELYSVPLAGGTPTKINDELHFAGDVRSFAVSPDGQSVAYTAGKTVGSSNELWFKPVTGAGTAVRISDPAPANTGGFDVSNGAGKGQVTFSPDSQTVYYLGDMTNASSVDLYAVDTTEKAGLTPSAFTYVGPDGGDFTTAANWEDADGNPLPADITTVDNQEVTAVTLVVDGDLIGGTRTISSTYADQIQFGLGASLEIINGATVNLTTESTSAGIDFDPGSGLKIVGGSLITNDDILFDGILHLENATLESTGDDIEFQDEYDATIINSTLTAADNLIIENAMSRVSGSTFNIADGISIRYDSDVTVTDTDITLSFDIEPLFTFSDGEGTSLTLKGAATLTADSVNEGTDLILDDQSSASLGSLDVNPASSTANPPSTMTGTNPINDFGYVGEDYESQIIFMSTEAKLELRFPVLVDEDSSDGIVDVRDLIINGLTGLSYNDDPSAWNISDWDGAAALPSLRLATAVTLAGDYNNDGVVDAIDYTVWRDNLGADVTLPNDTTPGSVDAGDFAVWESNYGAVASASSLVPEPTSGVLLLAALAACRPRRRS